MKKYFTILLFITSTSFAQKDTTKFRVDLDKLKKQIDSSTKMMDSLTNAQFKRMQDEELQRSMEQNSRNLDSFLRLQKEREAKQKKQMYIRLGIGVLFLGVLVVGLMRRRRGMTNKE
jgi:hypothetical protein